jgi:hypothetical protein
MNEAGLRVKQKDSRFGGGPSEIKDLSSIPLLLYGVWASATGRLLRYNCRITKTIWVALYEDASTCELAITAAKTLERASSIVRPQFLNNRPVTDPGAQVLGHTHTRKGNVCGHLLIKSVSIAEVEQEIRCGLHGPLCQGAVVFKCPEGRNDVWSEMARIRLP